MGDPISLLSHSYSKSNRLISRPHQVSGKGAALPHTLIGASKPQLWTQMLQEHPGGRCRMEQKLVQCSPKGVTLQRQELMRWVTLGKATTK